MNLFKLILKILKGDITNSHIKQFILFEIFDDIWR